MSGYSGDSAGNQSPVERATYLPKPFDYATLTRALRTSLERKLKAEG